MSSTREHPSSPQVLDLVVDFVERRMRGEAVDLEEYCRLLPEAGARIRSMVATWEALEERLELRGQAGSLARRIEGLFGAAVDPQVSLDQLPEDAPPTPSRPVKRYGTYGRYRFLEQVAQGAQGIILRVRDEDFRRDLAMKVLRPTEGKPGAPASGSRALGRFLEEAQITSQLDHPGVVPVHELGIDHDGRAYFTMKLVRGQDLEHVIMLAREGRAGWTLVRVLQVLLRVCEAMAYAHVKGVIHRDLKPSNVMVGHFGEVFVMDWGLAHVRKAADRKDIRIRAEPATETVGVDGGLVGASRPRMMTMDGDVVGTPAYMPPEQARGELEAIGPHSDVYSLGAMLYHALTGWPPYVLPAQRDNNYLVWSAVCAGPPRPVHVLAPDVPAELIAICEKSMAREPRRRYADMSELAEDLRAYLEHHVVRAYEAGAVAELRKWVQRNPALATVCAAAVLGILGGFGAVSLVQAHGRRLANEQRSIALHNAGLAERARADVMQLSAFQRLADLEAEADRLWPAGPQHLDAYRAWLEQASALVAGLYPDPARGDGGHLARIAELQARALQPSAAERAAQRSAHPRHAEFLRKRAQLAALRAAQEVRGGRAPLAVQEPDLAALPEDAGALSNRAWPLVAPQRVEFGREAEGLGLARRAFALVQDDRELAEVGLVLAWACFASGLDEEAIETAVWASSVAPPALRAGHSAQVAELREAVERSGEGAELAALEKEVAELDAELERSSWRFAAEEDRWWHGQLANLIHKLEAFADPETGLIRGISRPHGWGIERRLAFAAGIEERTVTGAEAAQRWAAVQRSISERGECPAYDGLLLQPQLGLLPLSRDPRSSLWEFVHLQTGSVPERMADGTLVIREETGVVFVLIPGGDFTIGAQSDDATAPCHDPQASGDEGPPHRLHIEPFFLAKHELTQAQWARIRGENPSYFQGQELAPSRLHPVESVSWEDAAFVLERLGLTLPREAQWEYAARARTATPFWTGVEHTTLEGAANLLDRRAQKHASWLQAVGPAGMDDGYAAHAPVHRYRPNPFGLHNILGNVWEWCQDRYDPAAYRHRSESKPLVGATLGTHGDLRALRGGSFTDPASELRSANRHGALQHYRHYAFGVRPARTLDRH